MTQEPLERAARVGGVMAGRANLAQLVVVAILLAVGTGVISSALTLFIGPSPAVMLGIGLAVVLAGVIFLSSNLLSQLRGSLHVEGAIYLDGKTRRPLCVERYDFAEDFERAIVALGSENKALGKAWKDNPFEKIIERSPKNYKSELTISHRLGVEAVEYYILRTLSTHLTDYFNASEDANKDELKELTRSDVPAVLLENRFIDLFSRPFEEREAFGSDFNSDNANVVYAVVSGGAVYDRFDLRLPKSATVSRISHGSVRIRTDRFSLTINIDLGGGSMAGGFEFLELYLGKKWDKVDVTSCNVCVDVQFKLTSLFSRKGWQYYRWLDGFLDRLDAGINVDRFLDNIGWQEALTTEIIRQRIERSNSPRRRRSDASSNGSPPS